jgi:hypothetical protein
MSINRLLFKSPFTLNNVPSWICPTCKTGILKGDKKSIKAYESIESKSVHSHEAWEPDWINGAFVGILNCSNSDCGEAVSILGKMNYVEGQEYDYELDRLDFHYQEELTPLQLYPTISIFQIQEEVPDKIKNIIMNSFSLYWLDLSSCANKIRTAAEYIMDDRKVPKTFLSKGKRKGHSLHKRIELFSKTNQEVAELLMAIKWIGNTGSHQFDNLTKDDILDSFEILEQVTFRLYDTSSNRIKKMSKIINKKRRPIGKRTIKKKSSR